MNIESWIFLYDFRDEIVEPWDIEMIVYGTSRDVEVYNNVVFGVEKQQ